MSRVQFYAEREYYLRLQERLLACISGMHRPPVNHLHLPGSIAVHVSDTMKRRAFATLQLIVLGCCAVVLGALVVRFKGYGLAGQADSSSVVRHYFIPQSSQRSNAAAPQEAAGLALPEEYTLPPTSSSGHGASASNQVDKAPLLGFGSSAAAGGAAKVTQQQPPPHLQQQVDQLVNILTAKLSAGGTKAAAGLPGMEPAAAATTGAAPTAAAQTAGAAASAPATDAAAAAAAANATPAAAATKNAAAASNHTAAQTASAGAGAVGQAQNTPAVTPISSSNVRPAPSAPQTPVQKLIAALKKAQTPDGDRPTPTPPPSATAAAAGNPAAFSTDPKSLPYYQANLTQLVLRVLTQGPNQPPALVPSPYSPDLHYPQVYVDPQALQHYMKDMGLQDKGLQQVFDQEFDLGVDPKKECLDWAKYAGELQVGIWGARVTFRSAKHRKQ